MNFNLKKMFAFTTLCAIIMFFLRVPLKSSIDNFVFEEFKNSFLHAISIIILFFNQELAASLVTIPPESGLGFAIGLIVVLLFVVILSLIIGSLLQYIIHGKN